MNELPAREDDRNKITKSGHSGRVDRLYKIN